MNCYASAIEKRTTKLDEVFRSPPLRNGGRINIRRFVDCPPGQGIARLDIVDSGFCRPRCSPGCVFLGVGRYPPPLMVLPGRRRGQTKTNSDDLRPPFGPGQGYVPPPVPPPYIFGFDLDIGHLEGAQVVWPSGPSLRPRTKSYNFQGVSNHLGCLANRFRAGCFWCPTNLLPPHLQPPPKEQIAHPVLVVFLPTPHRRKFGGFFSGFQFVSHNCGLRRSCSQSTMTTRTRLRSPS
jgi:hypothetical protein